MSHEGIRFVSPDEAASAQPEWDKLPRAAMTPGVVTPNIVAPTNGRASPEGRYAAYACAMPATAAAALPRICSETRLMPATSTTEYIMQISTAPT